MKRIIIFIFLPFFLFNCQHEFKRDKQVSLPPFKQFENYQFDLQEEVCGRAQKIPDMALVYLKEMDSNGSYKSYKTTDREKELLCEYISYLPGQFIKTLEEKLAAVFFVKNFMGGGMAYNVVDREGAMYSVLILNPEIMTRSIEEWISYRDNSAFDKKEGYSIRNTLWDEYSGLLHLLVHETAHIYDYHNHLTPYVDSFSRDNNPGGLKKTPFTRGVWDGYNSPVKKYDFRHRSEVIGYGLGETLPDNLIADIYTDLSKTPFTSLYATSNWAEDLAETFAWFYIYEKFGMEYEVTVFFNDSVAVKYSPLKNREASSRYEALKRSIGMD